ncbi:chitinase class I family protein [Pseudomonas fluorescens]|uniref:Chitinase class I family protein n=1 Tax=Pseudomonas fluorescens TaxID=294 RepID=A0A0P8X4W6_PSEFL|nr:glycoside hydrolase family 19 protein [Pseudomonas fluorescens]KPU61055.1 chitinase class I family protein [Pseudomonas fluorescens]
MSINRDFFFDHIRESLFKGSLRQSQLDGMTAILDKWEAESSKDDDRWLAYMLGTTHHETGRTMQPVRETFAATDDDAIKRLEKAWAARELPWVKTPYWHRDADGKSWFGRGFVQLTHKTNYEKLGTAINVDLFTDPDRAMDLDTALKVLFVGMRNGLFTSAKLSDFFNVSKENWVQARKIINGLESADLVASYAKTYYAAISYTVG